MQVVQLFRQGVGPMNRVPLAVALWAFPFLLALFLAACAGTPPPTPVPTDTPTSVPPTPTSVPESCANRGAVPNPQANPGLVADCEVLIAVKDTLAGSGTLNWSVNLDLRDWHGITIGESRNRVAVLDLADSQLTGEIPAELGNLPYLTELLLNGNHLTGVIPSELGDLFNLRVLSLAGNQLTGEIPQELGSLESLSHLSVSGNPLTGCIQIEILQVLQDNQTGLPLCNGATVVDHEINSSPLSHTDAKISAGDAVRWTNSSEQAHTVTHTPTREGQERLFDVRLQPEDSFAFQFSEPGEYRYACLVHPVQMWAVVTVTR